MKNLQSAGVMITQVACGARHSLALTTGECCVSYIVFDHQTSVENILLQENNNLLLTEREGCTGEYWPEVVALWTSLRSVRTKTTEGQYSSEPLELARLVSSLLYGTRTMLVLSLPAFENKKIHSL